MSESEIAVIQISPELYVAETGEGFAEVEIVDFKEKDGKTLACYRLSHPTAPIRGYWESEIGNDPSPFIRTIVHLYRLQNKQKDKDHDAY